jgi:hypothetical protein
MSYRLRQTNIRRPIHVWLILGGLLCGFGAASLSGLASAESNTLPTASQVFINEIKSGGGSPISQYATIYNASDQAVSLANWRLEYAKSTFPKQYCALSNWKAAVNNASTVTLPTAAAMGISIAAHTISAPIELSINDSDQGSIHLVDDQQVIRDTVGWGTTSAPAPCFEAVQAPKITSGKSLARYIGCVSNLPVDSDDNSLDFKLYDATPGSPVTVKSPLCNTPAVDDTPTGNATSCQGVIINELLPNPAGSDSGSEFIELYNPTNEVIDMKGCSLQTSASTTKTYSLDNISLQPGTYLSLSDSTTGLSLPNSNGGTAWLLNQSDELQAVTYPGDMEDDTAWMLTGDGWSASYTPTPGAANLATPLKPCDDGLVRNPETNRCVSLDTAATAATTATATTSSTLATCKVGQERNPDTNRCRNITNASSTSPTACKEGQERNPETNRCRAITGTTSDKTCPAGQERNPDTNRCRKMVAAAGTKNSGNIKDVSSETVPHKKPYALIAIATLAAAIAYGIYEWRQEIIGVIRKFLPKPAAPALNAAAKS